MHLPWPGTQKRCPTRDANSSCTCPEPSQRPEVVAPPRIRPGTQKRRPTRDANSSCTCPDLNWGPPPCQGGALTGLRYRCVRCCIVEVATGFEPVYTALQAVASPLGHSTRAPRGPTVRLLFRADDGIRTRDPHLGKVMRYQLRYVRNPRDFPVPAGRERRIRRHSGRVSHGCPRRRTGSAIGTLLGSALWNSISPRSR